MLACRRIAIIITSLLTVFATSSTWAGEADWLDGWDEVVQRHVKPGVIGDVALHVVDYQGIQSDPNWPDVLRGLEAAEEPADRDERMAFWINAYNAMTVKVVLSEYPMDSIKDAGGLFTQVWDKDAGTVAGETRTLSEIEHKILRPMGEPRIHAAIVCASVSCPPLRAEAFRAEKLDAQLADQMHLWLSNEKTGLKVEDGGTRVVLSPIFDWFSKDFGGSDAAVLAFVSENAPAGIGETVKPDAKIDYLDYDWSLNDSRRSKNGN